MKNTQKVLGTHSLLCAIALVAVIGLGLAACGGGDDGPSDTRVELIAGSAVSVGKDATSANVTFTGASGLTLAATDFTVSVNDAGTNGSIGTIGNGATVTVPVTFTANPYNAARKFTVGINSASTKIKGSATVVITQALNPSGETPPAPSDSSLTLTLTNVPVTIDDTPSSTDFTKCYDYQAHTNLLTDVITGTPKAKITLGGSGGTLTLELAKPKDAALYVLNGDTNLTGTTITPNTIKGFVIGGFITNDQSYCLSMTGVGNMASLIYVEDNATVNGTISGATYTNVSLKKGWNFVTIPDSGAGVASQTQPPAGITWYVYAD